MDMTSTMQALIPDAAAPGGVRMSQAPTPRPTAGEVLIDVRAISINRGETFQLENPAPGWRPGKDVAGVIVELGESVGGFAPGDRVVAHATAAGWAQRVAVEATRVAHLPAEVDWASAAPLGLAALTALRLTRVTGPLAARRVLLTGASGGVGHTFVQLAAAHGAELTAVVSDPERAQRLLALGASAIAPDIDAAAGPFDIALESTGGSAPAQAWSRLTQHGRLVWFGQASREPATLDFFDWRGATSGTIRRFHYAEDDTPIGVDLAALVRLLASDRLEVEIGLCEDWSRTGEALEALIARRVRGNAVLTLAPD